MLNLLVTKNKKLIALGIIIILSCLMLWLVWPDKQVVEVIEEPTVTEVEPVVHSEVIGQSVEGRPIEAYFYGDGEDKLLFVGGIHGGYEWNSVLLAYGMMEELEENPEMVPSNVTVMIVPSANPDGLYDVIKKEGRMTSADIPLTESIAGTGRLNRNGVDLNRNFDCKWQPSATWRGNEVSAGSAPFSEPEAVAIRDFVLEHMPKAVVFWHSQANAVYASECQEGILPSTLTLMNTYSSASGYTPVESFDSYPVTGDAEGWLASIGIPSVTVEFATHTSIDWQKNLAGVTAVLEHYDNTGLAR